MKSKGTASDVASSESSEAEEQPVATVTRTAPAFPFGPEFFLIQLRSFVREQCPRPEESLPLVEIHLSDGSVLDLCHVIAVTVRWLALAVREDSHGLPEMKMHTELVPYELICRVSIRDRAPDSSRVGFDTGYQPLVDTLCQGDARAAECSLLPSHRSSGEPDANS